MDFETEGSGPVFEVSQKRNHISVSCIFPGFDISDDELRVKNKKRLFKEIGINGIGFLSQSGKPLLPAFRRFVSIPRGCEVDVVVEKKARPVYFSDVLVTPAQEEVTDANVKHRLEFDEEAYEEDEYFPHELAIVGEPLEMDGHNVVLLEIYPIQFNAKKQKLRGYSNLLVKLNITRKEEGADDDFFPHPEVDLMGFGNLILNPDRGTQPNSDSQVTAKKSQYQHEFLIIYYSRFKGAAQKLAVWKNTKGISTEAVPISKIGNSVAKIKSYIRKKRSKASRLRYVLFLGDTNHIVTETVSNTASDYYYSTSSDPTGATNCLSPWIATGRIPVQSKSEADSIVEQIIRYESHPPCDPAYYDRFTAAAYFQDDDPQDGKANRAYMKTMETIRGHLVSIGKNVQRVYVSNNADLKYYKDGTAVSPEVKNAIISSRMATSILVSETAEGQMIVGHRDHGDTNGWSHPSFTNDNLKAIKSSYPSVFLSINCLTGQFNLSNSSDCFGERMLKLNGGAPSLIAASQLSGTWRNDSLIKGLFDSLFPGVLPTYPGTTASYAIKNNRIGDILNYAKMYLFVAHGQNYGVKNHLEMYHVLGDPTLEIWKAMPIYVPMHVRPLTNTVHIELDSVPAGAVVTVKLGEKIIKTSRMASNQMQLPLKNIRYLEKPPRNKPRQLAVVFTAPGHRCVEKKFAV